MLCDACNVRPGWKGEHRCHAPGGSLESATGPRELLVGGKRLFGNCECAQCKVPTPDEIKKVLREMHES